MTHNSPNASNPVLAWCRRAPELANFALRHIVNRSDVWVRYLPIAARHNGRKAFTAPSQSRRGIDSLTEETVEDHFGSFAESQLIAVHAIGLENKCKWFAVDIDLHGADDSAKAAANFRCACFLQQRCRKLGFDTLLIDSNGRGGFHLLGILAEPTASRDVFDFVSWLVRDVELTFGAKDSKAIKPSVEIFPHAPELSPGGFGRALRLPGRHHTDTTHFSRICDPGAQAWLAGDAAIDRILGVMLISPLQFQSVIETHVEQSKRIGTVRQRTSYQPRQESSPPSNNQEKAFRAQAYLDKLPKRLIDRRNCTAYGFAAFLAGDLGMSLEELMVWLKKWDDCNPARLQNERGYSQHDTVNKLEEIARSALRNNTNAKSRIFG